MKIYIAIAALLTLSSCSMFRTPKYKIGQKVTNGFCNGYVIDVYNYDYGVKYNVGGIVCKSGMTASSLFMMEDEIVGEAP